MSARNDLAQLLWDATRAQEPEHFMPTVMTDMGSCLHVADALIAKGVLPPEKGLVYQYRVQHPRYTEGLKDDFQWTRLLGIVQEVAQEWGPEAWIERRLVGPIERVETE